MPKPLVWTDVLGIADDLALFARRIEDKLNFSRQTPECSGRRFWDRSP